MAGPLNTGWAFYEAKNYPAAQRVAETRLQEDPHDSDGLLLLSRCLHAQGHHRRTLAVCLEWLEREPDKPQPYHEAVDASLMLRNREQARLLIDRYRRSFPQLSSNADMLEGRFGIIFEQHGLARKAYRKRLEAQPDDIMAKIELMTAEHSDGRINTTVRIGREILKADPLNAGVLCQLAIAEVRTMRFMQARAHARTLLGIDPTNIQMRAVIWMCYAAVFPPFFLGYLLFQLFVLAKEFLRTGFLVYPVVLITLAILSDPLERLVESINVWQIPDFFDAIYGTALCWWIWLSIYPTAISALAKRRAKAIKLQNY